MKSFLQSVWGIYVLSALGYTCVYVYISSYLQVFGIPMQVANVLLEDFFTLGLFVFVLFACDFIAVRAKLEEKPEFKLVNTLKTVNFTTLLFIPGIIILILACFLSHKELYTQISFILLITSFVFAFRLFCTERVDAAAWREAIIFSILSIAMSWSFGTVIALNQRLFYGIEIPSDKHAHCLLIKKNSDSEGIFKMYDTESGWEQGFYILNVDNNRFKEYDLVQTEKTK